MESLAKCLGHGLLGALWGAAIGVVLYLPACAVGTVATWIQIIPPGKPGERTDIADAFFWVCVVGGAIIGFVMKLAEEAKAAQARADTRAATQAAERRAHQEQQQQYGTELLKGSEESLKAFEALPKHLLDAESFLDRAERDFEEQAFSPFWDSIEQAAMRLGYFDAGIASIGRHAKRHGELSKIYEGKSPLFPLSRDSVERVAIGSTTADRMKAIVRRAQRNFQFASIYEQRRTNQILIAGFNNLAQALDGMADRLSRSIDDLNESVSAAINSLGDEIAAVNRSTVAVSESLQQFTSTFERDAANRAERHARALEMLDNIQRRRVPS